MNGHGKPCVHRLGDHTGSALIMVLWTLVLIGFLAGEYLEHNRGKASFAENAWAGLKQRQAAYSVLQLVATDSQPLPDGVKKKRGWTFLSPGNVGVWVKVESEANRINLNTVSQDRIRASLKKVLGQDHVDAVDPLADALLDWRDQDILVRMNGAEAEFYESMGLGYGPPNGPFRVLTELLLVRGVTRDLFWGDPMGSLLSREKKANNAPPSLLETFTVYGPGTKRVTILIPGRQKGYTLFLAFLKKQGGRWNVRDIYQSMLSTCGRKMKQLGQTESHIESL